MPALKRSVKSKQMVGQTNGAIDYLMSGINPETDQVLSRAIFFNSRHANTLLTK